MEKGKGEKPVADTASKVERDQVNAVIARAEQAAADEGPSRRGRKAKKPSEAFIGQAMKTSYTLVGDQICGDHERGIVLSYSDSKPDVIERIVNWIEVKQRWVSQLQDAAQGDRKGGRRDRKRREGYASMSRGRDSFISQVLHHAELGTFTIIGDTFPGYPLPQDEPKIRRQMEAWACGRFAIHPAELVGMFDRADRDDGIDHCFAFGPKGVCFQRVRKDGRQWLDYGQKQGKPHENKQEYMLCKDLAGGLDAPFDEDADYRDEGGSLDRLMQLLNPYFPEWVIADHRETLEAAGYNLDKSLTGNVKWDAVFYALATAFIRCSLRPFLVAFGAQGGEGKSSLFRDVLSRAFGKAILQTGMAEDAYAAGTNEIRKLHCRRAYDDARINIKTESASNEKLDAREIKSLATGDPLNTGAMRENNVKHVFEGVHGICTNSNPHFGRDGIDPATLRRMFAIIFTGKAQDHPGNEGRPAADKEELWRKFEPVHGALNRTLFEAIKSLIDDHQGLLPDRHPLLEKESQEFLTAANWERQRQMKRWFRKASDLAEQDYAHHFRRTTSPNISFRMTLGCRSQTKVRANSITPGGDRPEADRLRDVPAYQGIMAAVAVEAEAEGKRAPEQTMTIERLMKRELGVNYDRDALYSGLVHTDEFVEDMIDRNDDPDNVVRIVRALYKCPPFYATLEPSNSAWEEMRLVLLTPAQQAKLKAMAASASDRGGVAAPSPTAVAAKMKQMESADRDERMKARERQIGIAQAAAKQQADLAEQLKREQEADRKRINGEPQAAPARPPADQTRPFGDQKPYEGEEDIPW